MRFMDRIHGQLHALDQLHAQLASGRVHHAQIFHGPVGVGKFTTALAFTKVLLCFDPVADLAGRRSACGRCKSCQLLRQVGDFDFDASQLAHPDLHIITKELAATSTVTKLRTSKQSRIPVDLLRELMVGGKTSDDHYHDPIVGKTSQIGNGKFFLIDEAELLNIEGQNALLKTLEEPPTPDQGGGTTIILVTSNEDRLLPTIRSRCQRIAFVPLPHEVLDRYLQEYAERLEPVERSWLVGFAQGSLGRAKLVLDYQLTEWARVVLAQVEQLARGRAEPSLGTDMAERIGGFAEAWVKQHKNASKEAANKLAAGLMFSLVATYARQQLGKLAEMCDAADPEAAEAALLPWVGVIDALGVAEARLNSNVNLGLTCDGLASSIAVALRQRVMS